MSSPEIFTMRLGPEDQEWLRQKSAANMNNLAHQYGPGQSQKSQPCIRIPKTFEDAGQWLVTLWLIQFFWLNFVVIIICFQVRPSEFLTLPAEDVLLPLIYSSFLAIPYFITFLRTWLSDPGKVDPNWEEKIPLPNFVAQQQPLNNPSCCRYRCTPKRPRRAHHCRRSGACILRMDHYCPWVNNTIGYRNYRFFIQFLIYLPMFTMCCLLIIVYILYIRISEWSLPIFYFICLLVAFFTCLAVLYNGIPLLIQHGHLTSLNMTYLEQSNYDFTREQAIFLGLKATEKHIHHQGSKYENLKTVLGNNPCFWLVPIYIPLGDSPNGYYWKMDNHSLSEMMRQKRQIREKQDEELEKAGLKISRKRSE